MKTVFHLFVLMLVLAAGCASTYAWKPRVPAVMRTVAVPTFQNESELMEIGAVATRQVLREFQREGTFALASSDDAAIEIQGVVKSVTVGSAAYDRRMYRRYASYRLRMTVLLSVIDKLNNKVLVDNRKLTAETTMVSGQDQTTAERDASGRLADELSRQIVDEVLNLKW